MSSSIGIMCSAVTAAHFSGGCGPPSVAMTLIIDHSPSRLPFHSLAGAVEAAARIPRRHGRGGFAPVVGAYPVGRSERVIAALVVGAADLEQLPDVDARCVRLAR